MDGVSAPGRTWTDARVRTPDDEPLHGRSRLPELEGVEPIDDPALDVVGRLVNTQRPLVAVGIGAGALAGAALAGGGILRRLAGGVVGAVAGSGAALGIARLGELVDGRGASSSSAFVAEVPGATVEPRRGVAGERLRVLDWNVHDLIGPRGDLRTDGAAVDAIAAVVERERPDVLVLQELSQASPAGGMRDGLAELARRLGATDAVLVPNGHRAGGSAKGGAVLTFGDATIQDARGLRHPDPHGSGVLRRMDGIRSALDGVGLWPGEGSGRPGYFPRTTSDVLVTTAGGSDVRVLGVHLSGTGAKIGGSPETFRGQLGSVAGTLDAWQGPTLLLGDFNIRSGTGMHRWEAQLLRDAGLVDAFETQGVTPGDPSIHTFPSWKPHGAIDRIYASRELDVRSARVLDDEDARAGSDHLPVVADLEVR